LHIVVDQFQSTQMIQNTHTYTCKYMHACMHERDRDRETLLQSIMYDTTKLQRFNMQ